MSNSYARGRRRQHVYFVQENDEIVIHFTRPEWKEAKATLTCENGVVSISVQQGDIEVEAQLVKLHNPDSPI